MYDLHCHLLPSIDDGPSSMAHSLQLAQQAVSNGVSHAVVTPHIHHGRWDNTLKLIAERTRLFGLALAQADIELGISFAAELRIGPELMLMYEQQQLPILGQWQGFDVILLEFPHSHIPPGAENMVRWLIQRRVLPMIAHPERNKAVMRNLECIAPFVDQGCLLQVTAGAVIGQFGARVRDCARQLLTRDWVTVLASDAHHIKRRPVNLKEGYLEAIDIVGKQKAWDLVYHNPGNIIGEHLQSQQLHNDAISALS